MTRIFTHGFETRTTNEFWSIGTGIGGSIISPGRIDGWAAYIDSLSIRIQNNTEFFARFAYNVASNTPGLLERFTIRDANNANLIGLRWGRGNVISAYRSGETVPFAAGTIEMDYGWRLFEVHFNYADAGILEIMVDGEPHFSSQGDMKPANRANNLGYIVWSNGKFAIDDIAINDTQGAENNSWCGDGHVICLVPNLDDEIQLTPSSGTLHYPLVAERPPDTTTFVESNQAGVHDLYELTDYTFKAGTEIKRVWVQATARELTADGDKINLGLKLGTTPYWGSGQTLGIDWASYQQTWLTNPADSSVWETGDITNLKVGVKTE
jgi:hypothetical protein